MTCHRVVADGMVGFICVRGVRRRQCSSCKQRPASFECDFPLSGKKTGKTCDKAICEGCAAEVGPDRHFCPPHKAHADRVAAAPARDPLATAHAEQLAGEQVSVGLPDAAIVEPWTEPTEPNDEP